jgi:hypothetical protein
MRYHWMIRHEDNSPDSLKKVFQELNSYGYYSCMLTYHSKKNDMFIKLARSVDPEIKLKYIIAMRTYAISPEYLAMMINGFNEIAKDKLIFNIVSGDIHKDETSIEDLVDSSYLLSSQDRVSYTGKWLEKFVNIDIIKNNLPKMFMSGTSEKTFNHCERFNGGTLTMVDYFLENIDFFSKFKTKCVSLQICIRDTDEEAEKIKNEKYSGNQLKWCYYYSENTLIKKIKELESLGVTDLMITGLQDDPELYRVHQFVKKMSGE